MKNDENEELLIGNYSTKDLIKIKNDLEFRRGEIIEDWGEEIGKYTQNPNFDQYSRRGERIFSKITKKYSSASGEITFILDEIEKELEKREKYNYEQRFIAGGNYEKFNDTEDEFLEKEEEKTVRHRYDLDLDEYEKFDDNGKDFDDDDDDENN